VKDDAMITILQKKGIAKLFPIQYETFDIISKGEDVVAKDRTGSGKTLAFTLPIITSMRSQSKFKGNHSPKFLVVLPTRYSFVLT
jgi:ATP-dependent RNA helicase DDX21